MDRDTHSREDRDVPLDSDTYTELLLMPVLMSTVRPDSRDIDEIRMAIASFKTACGSVQPGRAYRPAIDPTALWMMIPATTAEMTDLWKRSGIPIDESFSNMLASRDCRICFTFHKVSCGWFKRIWVGNASLDFAGGSEFIGSIAGTTQARMWQRLHSFIDDGDHLYNSTEAAINAVS
jgi:hypothetical protein